MMRRALWLLGGCLLGMIALGIAAVGYIRASGLDARTQPGPLETRLARAIRPLAVPPATKASRNPVPLTVEALDEAMGHFADHCANCHANDGSGDTELGRGLYPKAPDMRLSATQNLSDGELFYVIEHGIRFTGMPAWRTGTSAGEEASWQLVHFIRHLPRLTAAEAERMQQLNPRSPEEIRLEIEEERFLNEGVP
jgi:mono/diheme cytochrome c family protein